MWRSKKTQRLLLHHEWYRLCTTLHLFDSAGEEVGGGGMMCLSIRTGTTPFMGRTPASEAAPLSGADSCPPVFNARPPRARAKSALLPPRPRCLSYTRSGGRGGGSVRNDKAYCNSVSVPGTQWLRASVLFPIKHHFDTNLWEFESCNQLWPDLSFKIFCRLSK